MSYSISDNIEYDVNTNWKSRDIAKMMLAVMDNPNHEHAEYILSQAINRIMFGIRGEYMMHYDCMKDITVGNFLRHKTDVGQVVKITRSGYNFAMVEIDDEDLFNCPCSDAKIKSIKYDYNDTHNGYPLITIDI